MGSCYCILNLILLSDDCPTTERMQAPLYEVSSLGLFHSLTDPQLVEAMLSRC